MKVVLSQVQASPLIVAQTPDSGLQTGCGLRPYPSQIGSSWSEMEVRTQVASAVKERSNPQKINKDVACLGFLVFVIVTSEFAVVGLMPEIANEIEADLSRVGWLATVFAIGAALIGAPVTMLTSRFQPKHFLIVSSLAFALANLLLSLVDQLITMVIVRFLQGCILPSMVSMATMEAIQMAKNRSEGWAISRVSAGVAITSVIGLPGSVMVAEIFGWRVSFFVLAVLGILSALFVARIDSRESVLVYRVERNSALNDYDLPSIVKPMLLSLILFTGMFCSYTYITVTLQQVAQLSAKLTALVLVGFGVAGVVGNLVSGRISVGSSLKATMALVIGFAVVFFSFEKMLSSSFTLGLSIVVWGAMHGASFVICQLRAIAIPGLNRAFALSLNISVCNLGIAAGGWAGGVVIDYLGVSSLGYISAGIMILAFVGACYLQRLHE